jgi:hypothetical protein
VEAAASDHNSGAAFRWRFQLNPAAVLFNDFFDDRQS